MMNIPTDKQKARSLLWMILANRLMQWSLRCAFRSGCGIGVAIAYADAATAVMEDAGQRRVIPYKAVLRVRELRQSLGA